MVYSLDLIPDKSNELHLPSLEVRVVLLLDLLPTTADEPSLPTQLYHQAFTCTTQQILRENRRHYVNVLPWTNKFGVTQDGFDCIRCPEGLNTDGRCHCNPGTILVNHNCNFYWALVISYAVHHQDLFVDLVGLEDIL
uniref:Uncharacterized protein n=1 Tax=Erpetoichthys calabaricus TaxID=27687 RepID=A0A8C4TFY1_ERPCA